MRDGAALELRPFRIPGIAHFEHPAIPAKAQRYLDQAVASKHAPDGAVLMAAAAVDAMLKKLGYEKGSLYVRIDQAVADHVLTKGMGAWAHQVRLEANEQRHADEATDHATPKDADRMVEFAKALATFLFVMPQRVKDGIIAAGGTVNGGGLRSACWSPATLRNIQHGTSTRRS